MLLVDPLLSGSPVSSAHSVTRWLWLGPEPEAARRVPSGPGPGRGRSHSFVRGQASTLLHGEKLANGRGSIAKSEKPLLLKQSAGSCQRQVAYSGGNSAGSTGRLAGRPSITVARLSL